jgi:tetratricopeptide (TPR) repeat protein
MRKSRMGKVREFVLEFGISWVAVKSVVHPVARLLFAIPAIAVIALASLAAQTESPKAAEIHDHLQKAEAYLKAKDSNSAGKEFQAVLMLDPNNAEAHGDLGVIAFVQRDYETAARHFSKTLAINPSLTKTQALLAICRKRLGDPSARALLEKSFPKLKDKQLRLQVGMELASLYDQQGDPGATASVMTSLVDLDPDNIDVLFMAQRVYSELADNTLNKLAVLAPGSARMQQVIAERLVNEADLKGAIDPYRKALAIDPNLPGVHFELGEAILELAAADAGAEAEAQRELELAVAIDGDTAKTECEFGSIALLRSQSDQALSHYRRASELDPNEVQAQMGLVRLLMPEQPQEAVRHLRMAVQSDPLNGSAHYQLAQAYRRLQMEEMAQKEMHLFEEIKETKDRVEELYHQMKQHPKLELDELGTKETANHDQ